MHTPTPTPPTPPQLRHFRQTCRLRVRANGAEHVVRLLFDHQEPRGLNARPVGDRVHFETLGWLKADEVEVLEILPWREE